jgi:hypothetical protein
VTQPDAPERSGNALFDTLDIEPGPAVVGLVVGVGGLLFLLEPLVGPVAIGSVRARPVALSTVVLAAGFCLGAPVFLRRGRRLFGLAHGIFGVAWAGVAVGTAARSGTIVVGAVLLVVAGAGFLVVRARQW